jgi:hypothetical protein
MTQNVRPLEKKYKRGVKKGFALNKQFSVFPLNIFLVKNQGREAQITLGRETVRQIGVTI